MLSMLAPVAACSSSSHSTERAATTTSHSPTSAASPTSGPTDTDGTWTRQYSWSQFDQWTTDWTTPGLQFAPTPSTTIAQYHAEALLESAGCTKFVERLQSGNWTTSEKAAIEHYATDVKTVICPISAAQAAATTVSQYLAATNAHDDRLATVHAEGQTIDMSLSS